MHMTQFNATHTTIVCLFVCTAAYSTHLECRIRCHLAINKRVNDQIHQRYKPPIGIVPIAQKNQNKNNITNEAKTFKSEYGFTIVKHQGSYQSTSLWKRSRRKTRISSWLTTVNTKMGTPEITEIRTCHVKFMMCTFTVLRAVNDPADTGRNLSGVSQSKIKMQCILNQHLKWSVTKSSCLSRIQNQQSKTAREENRNQIVSHKSQMFEQVKL